MSRFLSRRLVLPAAALLAGAMLVAAPDPAQRKFTLVYNVNNSGYIDVCGCKHKEVRQGSITRRASFLKQLRGTGRELLLVDGGSSFFTIEDRVKESDLPEAVRKAELLVEAYNRMGYRAMAVGSFDLAAGLNVLKDLEKKAKFPFLSANLVDKATQVPIFNPHVVIEVGGLKVGLLGLTLNTMSRSYLMKVAPNTAVTDPLEAAKKSLAELSGKADLIIALSHLREETNFELIAQLKELEVVIDPYIQYGNHHTWIKDEEWLTFRDDTLLLRSDGQGARMGVLDVKMVAPRAKFASEERVQAIEQAVGGGTATPEEKAELEASRRKNLFVFQRVSLEPHHLTDPEMDLLIAEWKKNIDPSKVAHLEAELPKRGEYLTVDGCRKCHEKVYEFWKTTKHSRAMASLEATNDQHRFDCVGCHSLAYGQAFLDTSKMGSYGNVQCESCHGTNPKHAEDPKAHAFSKASRANCIVCHNKEQTRSEFNFGQARQQIQCPKA
jgi:2',3'-cyclic-nucleotide 2'-phosphodiesterase (5'-nucleotidase family)